MMNRPECDFPEPSPLAALLRAELLRRAKQLAHSVEEQVRRLTQPQEQQAPRRQPAPWPDNKDRADLG